MDTNKLIGAITVTAGLALLAAQIWLSVTTGPVEFVGPKPF